MSGFNIVNISELKSAFGKVNKEDRMKELLSSFSCPNNRDVEEFLKYKALDFDAQGISATHIVTTAFKGLEVIVGYFTLSNKYVVVKKKNISKTYAKKIRKFGAFQPDTCCYSVSIPLIAQLGKNFTNNFNELISGDELLKMACDKVQDAQRLISGKLVYIECENNNKLIDFYKDNGFVYFGERTLEPHEKSYFNGKYLVQMLKYLHK